MEKINFIGAYDKTDSIMYIAKILTEMKKKVIIVDATITQKTKYVIPTIDNRSEYIANYANIDFAIGFTNYNDIKTYLGMPQSAAFTYDYMLIDIDNSDLLNNFDVYSSKKNYFVTSFDLYALKKGVEVLKRLSLPVEIMKVYFSNLMSQSEDDYFNYIATGCRVKWNQDKIYFPLLNEDLDVIKENQRLSKIRFKGLSNEYKTSLMEWTQDICGDSNGVKKACRQIERGV
ncbi:MAG: hypothetical protein KHW52_05025 [Clostridium sp.]|jgi:hypothetical protein|nr:hypothetical protein [Clostridium sp.]OKZ86433.1 MAG: hypothetical protein BHW09_06335 [Clostridium sp. CAG:245_30_32]CDA58830.1 putative uncharacterized protein pPPM1a_131 [Clostridium sp. CAG:245]DAK92999.1 MAG TPA: nickel binding protein [Caudoviricetes sp.]